MKLLIKIKEVNFCFDIVSHCLLFLFKSDIFFQEYQYTKLDLIQGTSCDTSPIFIFSCHYIFHPIFPPKKSRWLTNSLPLYPHNSPGR